MSEPLSIAEVEKLKEENERLKTACETTKYLINCILNGDHVRDLVSANKFAALVFKVNSVLTEALKK